MRPGRDNLIATYTPPGPAPFTVLFEAHQDTVPVDAMTIDPFGAKVEGGKLYGRGSCDVKAGVAVMLDGASAGWCGRSPLGSAKVIVAFTVDEENGGLGVSELMKSGLRADYAIVAEPTLLNIVNAHKGVARWLLETSGRACHSSRPEQGVNAVYRMARLFSGVEEYAEKLRALPPDPGSRTADDLRRPRRRAECRRTRCPTACSRRSSIGDCCRARRLRSATADLDAFLRAQPGVDFPFTLGRVRPVACH